MLAMLCRLDIPLAEVRAGVVHTLDAYWRSKRAGKDIPSWSDIDPSEMKRLLPCLFVVEIQWTPFRVYYRLVGTQASLFRGDLTGRFLDEIEECTVKAKEELADFYRLAAEERRPVYCEDEISMGGRPRSFFGGIFPLSPAGQPADRCLAIEDFGKVKPKEVAQHRQGTHHWWAQRGRT
jgi:hypothetical protein